MNKEQKIAKIISVIKLWGGFSPSEVDDSWFLVIGELGNLVGMVTYVSLSCIDISVYNKENYSNDNIHDYTMEYSELTDEVLDELVILCNKYNEVMLEQEEE